MQQDLFQPKPLYFSPKPNQVILIHKSNRNFYNIKLQLCDWANKGQMMKVFLLSLLLYI